MLSWNYRVLQYENDCFGIHEVYYTKKNKITMWSAQACTPYGLKKNLKDLKWDLKAMAAAMTKPIIKIKKLPGYKNSELHKQYKKYKRLNRKIKKKNEIQTLL